MWLFSKQLTEYSVTKVLFWLAVLGTLLSLPLATPAQPSPLVAAGLVQP